MSRTWFLVGVLGAVALGLYATLSLVPERQTPEQRAAAEALHQRCRQAEDATRQALTRFRAGNPGGLVEVAELVNELGVDDVRCPDASRQVFDSARDAMKRLFEDVQWFVLNSEIEIETVSALIAGWGTPEDRETWPLRREKLVAAVAAAHPAVLDILATENGEPTCREDSLQQSETQRISFRRVILEHVSALYPEHPIVMGRLADERIAAGITPLSIDADFQFELFADTRPGTGMRIWIPGRLVITFTAIDEPPLRFSVEREVPENVTTTIWKCDWEQAEQLLKDLLATLPQAS